MNRNTSEHLFVRRAAAPFTLIGIMLMALSETALCVDSYFTRIQEGPMVTNSGATFGVSWADLDGDGLLDIYVAGAFGPDAFYRNLGDDQFEEFGAIVLGELTGTGLGSTGALFLDFDNDGDIDSYITKWSTTAANTPALIDEFYINDGSGDYSIVFQQKPGSIRGLTQGAAVQDLNNDGILDFIVPAYNAGVTASKVQVYRSLNAFEYEVVTEGLGDLSSIHIKGTAAVWADYDDDGDSDLLITSGSNGQGLLLLENVIGRFELVSQEDFPYRNFVAQAADWGDFDNDGDFDILVALDDGVAVLENIEGRFEEWNSTAVQSINFWTRAVAWADFDNDGWLDFVVGPDFPMSDRSMLLGRNLEGEDFEIIDMNDMNSESWSAAWADYNNDGFLDLYVSRGGLRASMPNRLYRNEPNGNNWLMLDLSGTQSNRSAIGTKVEVEAIVDGIRILQVRQLQASRGYSTQHDPRVHFGLGDATVAEIVRIVWPTGETIEYTNVAADQILSVVEPPVLAIDDAVVLSWPMSAEGYSLFGAGSVDGPYTAIDTEVTEQGGRATVTVITAGAMRFYQLRLSGAQ